ncbi:ferric-dicitrate binding protein FerR (iron transport regulator) [Spirosoma lacussanchae]|uniref:FecR family protein n=1 Tax=Spirosoma lacussanchae TaxID=1884249 RepID=UPI0011082869|nr:FecR domain-containing protein [Spirosoma lacussanchae]
MNYTTYTAEDFLLDDRFRAYCQQRDSEAVLFWKRWQQSNPPNLAAFREAERLYSQPQPSTSHQRASAQPHQTPSGPVSRRWLVVAALAAVLVLLGLGYWFWQQQYVTEATAFNERRTVTLPDGSTVALNSHSTLRYQRSNFTELTRAVELTGEGYFDIKTARNGAPFTVRTDGSFDVQALGTTFSVQNRPHQQRVVLNSGQIQVSFHDARPAVTLQPGQLLETSVADPQPRQRTVRPTLYNAWTRDQLVFENASLIEVIWTLEEQFGIPVRLENTVPGNQTLTGILPISDPETVLRSVAELSRLNIRQTEHGFVLHP